MCLYRSLQSTLLRAWVLAIYCFLSSSSNQILLERGGDYCHVFVLICFDPILILIVVPCLSVVCVLKRFHKSGYSVLYFEVEE